MARSEKTEHHSTIIARVESSAKLLGSTRDKGHLLSIFSAFENDSFLVPTYASESERKRKKFDPAWLVSRLGSVPVSGFHLSRTSRPKYEGGLSAGPGPIEGFSIDHEEIDANDVPSVCKAFLRLMDKFQPVWAALHFRWLDPSSEQKSSSKNVSVHSLDFEKCGPPGVFAWNWYGPHVVSLIGMSALEAVGAKRTSWGGAWLPLVEHPWAVPFSTLRRRQLEVDAALRKLGVFGDYSDSDLPEPGPNWVSPKLPPTPELEPTAMLTPTTHAEPKAIVPEAWNTSRGQDDPVEGGDVRGMDFRKANLVDVFIQDVAADGADFRGANFVDFCSSKGSYVGARFDGAHMEGARFFDAVLSEANFENADMTVSFIGGCIVERASFVRATLRISELGDTNFQGSNFDGASLEGAAARKAIFRGANLRGVDFRGAELTEADFRGADLTDIHWKGAKLDGALFDPGADPRERGEV